MRDSQGQLLAYVYLEDGSCLNVDIIRDGFAKAYTKYKFHFRDYFKQVEKEAMDNKRGLWSK